MKAVLYLLEDSILRTQRWVVMKLPILESEQTPSNKDLDDILLESAKLSSSLKKLLSLLNMSLK